MRTILETKGGYFKCLRGFRGGSAKCLCLSTRGGSKMPWFLSTWFVHSPLHGHPYLKCQVKSSTRSQSSFGKLEGGGAWVVGVAEVAWVAYPLIPRPTRVCFLPLIWTHVCLRVWSIQKRKSLRTIISFSLGKKLWCFFLSFIKHFCTLHRQFPMLFQMAVFIKSSVSPKSISELFSPLIIFLETEIQIYSVWERNWSLL